MCFFITTLGEEFMDKYTVIKKETSGNYGEIRAIEKAIMNNERLTLDDKLRRIRDESLRIDARDRDETDDTHRQCYGGPNDRI